MKKDNTAYVTCTRGQLYSLHIENTESSEIHGTDI